MKTLNEIEVLLNEKLKDNAIDIKSYDVKVQEAEETQQKADIELLAAENEVNVDKYNETKNAIWSAKHAKELYLKQQDKLKKERLVTKVEYNQLLSEITQVANATHEEQNDRAAALIAELAEISEESSQTWKKANSLMTLLQRRVYKEPEGAIPLEDGGTTWSSNKEYKNFETVHNFYNSKVKGSILSKRAGEGTEQAIKSWGNSHN